MNIDRGGVQIADEVALVTGGLGGIGRATCIALAEAGANVVCADILESSIGAAEVSTMDGGSGRITYCNLDVTDENSVSQAVSWAKDTLGPITILVNNAGIAGPLNVTHESTSVDFHRIFDVNVKGTWLCTKYVVQSMLEEGRGGRIVNVSSINGLVGGRKVSSLYQATKGAVRLMAKADALAYAGAGIRVNSIHPGSVETQSVIDVARSYPEGEEIYNAQILAAIPMSRRGKPNEIARGVLFLVSPESSYMTGAELVIDGGFTAQ